MRIVRGLILISRKGREESCLMAARICAFGCELCARVTGVRADTKRVINTANFSFCVSLDMRKIIWLMAIKTKELTVLSAAATYTGD